ASARIASASISSRCENRVLFRKSSRRSADEPIPDGSASSRSMARDWDAGIRARFLIAAGTSATERANVSSFLVNDNPTVLDGHTMKAHQCAGASVEVRKMETLSWPIPQRIAHYQSEASRLRHVAEAEPIAAIREELLAVARQYQQLADGLKTGEPF